MSGFWFIPADEQSYQKTLAEQCNLSPAPDRPDSFPERVRAWGVRTDPHHPKAPWERNERNLERMEPGDPLLIYRNAEGFYDAFLPSPSGTFVTIRFADHSSSMASRINDSNWVRSIS